MTDLALRAAARAAYQSAHGPRFPGPNGGAGQCMMRCRLLVDAPAIGDYDGDGMADAEDGWKFAKHRHPTSNPAEIPGGCYAWWGAGSHDNGHVAFTDPTTAGYCWSTDIDRIGYFDRVPISLINRRWGLPLLGWSEDIDGVRVYDPTNQEDDMTPDDILKAKLAGAGDRYVSTVLAATYNRTARIEDALRALAAGISPTVEAAVKEALADAVVDVDVNVHDKTGA
jgi:hypothetical protein